VRARMRGGDGGHRGVRSVLESFATDEVRRVRIGVGRPEQKDQVSSYVLSSFSPTELPLIEKACEEAADLVLDLLAKSYPSRSEELAPSQTTC
jgi:PTH1 family peptidyl-tRNA hydrolase